MCVYVHVRTCTSTYVQVSMEAKRPSDPRKLELQTVVSHQIWVGVESVTRAL